MIDIAGLTLSREDETVLQHPLVGGVILFTRNYESIAQLQALVNAIHLVRKSPLLVAVDHEGGRVQRFRKGFSRLPAVAGLGKVYSDDRRQAVKLAETSGWLMAAELRAVGVDFSFAPVLDLDRGVCSVIGDRAFHQQADVVSELAHAYMGGMKQAGMAAVGKHFPGHGAVAEDSHLDLPIDHRQFVDIEAEDIVPFARMVRYGLAGVMPAHVIYDQVDSLPAGFSPIWLNTILRQQLDFQGVIFSDDVSMAAAAVGGTYTERTQVALQAGCDMVLVCNNRQAVLEILQHLNHIDNPASQIRLVRMHGGKSPDYATLTASQRWQQAVSAVQSYAPVDPELDMDLL